MVAADTAPDGTTPDGTAGVTAADHQRAVRLLDRIALAAAGHPAVTVRDGQYIYTESEGSSDVWGGPTQPLRDSEGQCTRLKTCEGQVRSEEWRPVNGEGGGLRRLAGLTEDGEPDPAWTNDMDMPDVPYLTFRELQALPTDDPDALLRELKGGSGVEESRLTETVFENVGVILDQAILLPDLSAALYRAVARLPGVYAVDDVQDASGRTGASLTYGTGSDQASHEPAGGYWVFDPETLPYLGTSESALLDVGVADEKGGASAQ